MNEFTNAVLSGIVVLIIGAVGGAAITWFRARDWFTANSSQIRIFKREHRDRNGANTMHMIKKAKKEIIVTGASLEQMLTPVVEMDKLIKTKLDEKCEFRLLMSHPQNANINAIVHYYGIAQAHKSIGNRINECLEGYKNISKKYNQSKNCFTLKLEKGTLLPYRLLFIDKDEPHGVCRVELYLIKEESTNRPTFLLSKKNNPEMFKLFSEQFEQGWIEGEQVQT